MVTVEAAYTKNHETRGVTLSETLTATLKSLKISKSCGVTALLFQYLQMIRSFTSGAARAKIPKSTFHDRRHTMACRRVVEGTT